MNKYRNVLVLGSGALRIGQAGEFDYSGSQALKALKEENIRTVLLNPNIATVQTTPGFADEIYLLPLEPDFVEKVIARERPDGILLNVGGQTALNTGVALWKSGVLTRYGVAVLGTSPEAIIESEDRQKFAEKMRSLGVSVPQSGTANSVEQALALADRLGFPLMVRAGFSLGGLSSGPAHSVAELKTRVEEALCHAPHVLLEEYLAGWKEVEYEVVRDRLGNAVAVCNMENMDPMGIHTGESIVVAPSQTLTNDEYHLLRSVALKVAAGLGVIGECNVQFALHPGRSEYRVIEINARLSRSSALASKATGYPLAWVATKLGLGYCLAELKNSVTGVTGCFFEPALDYVTVKIPRWDLSKFRAASRRIGSEMKSVGEVMAIGATFEEALQKAVRSLGLGYDGLTDPRAYVEDPEDEIRHPTDRRLYALAQALAQGVKPEKISAESGIDPWFISRLLTILQAEQALHGRSLHSLEQTELLQLKRLGFSDRTIARCINATEDEVRQRRHNLHILPRVRRIDTLAGEFPATTNYLYMTYAGDSSEVPPEPEGRPVLILGSGPYCIGSSVEFDWCSVGMCTTAARRGYHTVMVNCNPETVSTDYDMNDRLYFEELTLERVLDIAEYERPLGVVVSVGGQIPNNLALGLARHGVRLLGTEPDSIDRAENRHRFSLLLDELEVAQPAWQELRSLDEARAFAASVGYPVLIRPSYVLSGAAMNIAKNEKSLEQYLTHAARLSPETPVVISKFLEGAKEIEIDGVAQDGELVIYCLTEHVELSGVHSGDATVVLPPQNTYLETVRRAKNITKAIIRALKIHGPFNIQFLARDNNIWVIECNLRASRSFPFVSKATGYNFIEFAARVLLGEDVRGRYHTLDLDYVAVKVPQFSFSRLKGADPILYVEMTSTGESACLGESLEEAWLKAALANGLRLPQRTILVSLGGEQAKAKLLEPLRELSAAGYDLYATPGTHAFLSAHDIRASLARKVSSSAARAPNVLELISTRKVECVVNVPRRAADETALTDGYRIRRAAADYGIPLINDVELARLFFRVLLHRPPESLGIKPLSAYVDRGKG